MEPARIDWSQLPHRPDYAAIARMAQNEGRELGESAIREAFRVIMRARSIRPISR